MGNVDDNNNFSLVETSGGTYIEGDVHSGRDVAGRDINYYGIECSPRKPVININLDELFSQALRLQITGKLGEALEICRRIQAVEPYFPRLNVVMTALELEFKKGSEKHYLNMWSEVDPVRLLKISINRVAHRLKTYLGISQHNLLQLIVLLNKNIGSCGKTMRLGGES